MDEKEIAKYVDEAMQNGDFERAYKYRMVQAQQEELNKLRSQRIDMQNFMISPSKTVYITATDATAYAHWEQESTEEFKKRQELDERRNFKLFVHHAKLFCERFPNWTVTPDPNNPFKNVTINHKNNKYKIESASSSNEIKCYGIMTDAQHKTNDFANKFGIPRNIFRLSPETIPMPLFFGWSIGMEDVPAWIKE